MPDGKRASIRYSPAALLAVETLMRLRITAKDSRETIAAVTGLPLE
jgi:hypothetical protein